MDDSVLAYARSLEAEDAALAAEIDEAAALQAEADELRARAAGGEAFLTALPAEREAAQTALAAAEAELDRRRAERRAAEEELERAEGSGKDERIAAARRALVRARDSETSAARKLDRASEALEALEREAEAIRAESPQLEERARMLAERLRGLPRASSAAGEEPGPGLAGVAAWAARAQAALFVVRGSLEGERERVVRQANELAAGALGEPLYGASVALVRRRLERR